MLFLIITFVFSAFSYVGEPIEVKETQYLNNEDSPSCSLLKHRHKEREKVIREIIYESEKEYTDSQEKFMRLNYLNNNKFFLDKSVWTDEVIEVSITAPVSEALKKEIDDVGFDKLFLSIDGVGVRWSSQTFNFPNEFNIQLSEDQKSLKLQYRIYQSEYCFRELTTPRVSWVSHQNENIGEFICKDQTANEIQEESEGS